MCRYACQVRCQKHKQVTWAFFCLCTYLYATLSFSCFQEIIAELQTMVRALLIEYKRKTCSEPSRIIFYRDGVSEGQFQQVHAISCLADCYQTLYYTIQVLEEELRAIQLACSSLSKNYRPGITMIIVQKRHHTRLFPVNDRDRVCDLNKHM